MVDRFVVMTLQCMQMWSHYVTPEGNLMLYVSYPSKERKKEKE